MITRKRDGKSSGSSKDNKIAKAVELTRTTKEEQWKRKASWQFNQNSPSCSSYIRGVMVLSFEPGSEDP